MFQIIQDSESDYWLLASFIAVTLSLLNPKINHLKIFGQVLVFTFLSTEWSVCRVVSGTNSQLNEHRLNKIKYMVFSNKIFGFYNKFYHKIN